MFDIGMYLEFKKLIESIFGEDFYDIRLVKDTVPANFKMFESEWDNWIQYSWSKKFVKIPHESYFSCVITPILPPSGESFLVVVSYSGGRYFYRGASNNMTDLTLISNESESLKGLILDNNGGDLFFEDLILLNSQHSDIVKKTNSLLTLEEWDYIHSFNGYMRRSKNYPDTIAKLKEIGNRFPNRHIPYLYRGIGNKLFYEEIASSFETPCTKEKETVLYKNLNQTAQKYLQYYIRGLSSWSIHKHKTTPYLNQARHHIGGGILMIWINPKPQEIILDTDPIYEYAEGKFPEKADPLNGGEVLAKPLSSRIIGVKRFLHGKTCDYIVILRS